MPATSIAERLFAPRDWWLAIGQVFISERERWPLWLPVMLGGGIGLYFSLQREPAYWIAPTVLVLMLLVLLLSTRKPAMVIIGLGVSFVALGFSAAHYRAHSVASPVLARSYGPAPVIGRVVAVEAFAGKARLLLDRVSLRGVDSSRTPERVRVRLRDGQLPEIGSQVSVLAKLMPPARPAAPGAYDFRRHAWFLKIGAVGFALGPVRTTRHGTADGDSSFGLWVSGIRHDIAQHIRATVPGAPGAMAAALITGDRSAISADVLSAMRESGLAHLLAISGLHMGLVAAILFYGLRAAFAFWEGAALRFPVKKWSAAAALLGAAGYLVLTGATVPTQRAFIMTGLVLIAVMVDRTAISLRLVAWAAVIILLCAPESLLGPSFQMSFAAVVSLVAVYERGWRPMSSWVADAGVLRRLVLYAGGIAATTLVAGAATGLFAMYHFGQIAHYGLAANLVAVPVTALWIMPWAVLSMILMPFGLAEWGLLPMSWGVALVIEIARTVSNWPGAVALVPAMPVAGLVAAVLGGLWLCLWRHRWRYWGVAGILAGFLSLAFGDAPDILVADDGRLMAVKNAEGRLLLSDTRRSKRTAQTWLARAGQRQVTGLQSSAGPDAAGCDSLGCQVRVNGYSVAFANDGRALQEDCRLSDIVVSTIPVRGRCGKADLVVDRFDLWRHGAHAIWLNQNQIRVETISGTSGIRPWAPSRLTQSRQYRRSNPIRRP